MNDAGKTMKSRSGLKMFRNTCQGRPLLRRNFLEELQSGLPERDSYLEGLGNKFIDKIYVVPSTYGACDARTGG